MGIAKTRDLVAYQNLTSEAATVVSLATIGAATVVGNHILVRVAVDNTGTNGAAPGLTITDTKGNTWASVAANRDPGAASAGITCYVGWARITAALDDTDTITFTWAAGNPTAKAIVAEEWSGFHRIAAYAPTSTSTTNGQSSTPLNTGNPTLVGQLFYAALAIEGPSTDSYTEDADTTGGSWTTLTAQSTANPTADLNATIRGAYKVVTATGSQSWGPTITNRDWAIARLLVTADNDDFADAQVLTGASGSVTTGTTDATAEASEPDPSAGGDKNRSVWFSWTAPATADVTFQFGVANHTFTVYTGVSLGALTEIVSRAGTTAASFRATSGTTYLIQVVPATIADAAPAVSLVWSTPAAPANNNFPGTTISTIPASVTGTLVGATTEVGEPTPAAGGSLTRSVWWSWTAPTSGPAFVQTVGSAVDTVVAVYTGAAVGALTEVASNDDGPTGYGTTSRVTFTAVAGTTYRIQVIGKTSTALGALSVQLDGGEHRGTVQQFLPSTTTMPRPRAGGNGAPIPFTDYIALVGGENADGLIVDVDCFHLASGQWCTDLVPPLPAGRGEPVVVWGADRTSFGPTGPRPYIIVIGGRDDNGDATDTVYRWRWGDTTWTAMTPMPTARYAAARFDPNDSDGLRQYDHEIHVVNGADSTGTALACHEKYHALTDTWTTYTDPPFANAGQSLIMQSPFAATSFYILGGRDPAVGTVWRWSADTWTSSTQPPFPTGTDWAVALFRNTMITHISDTDGAMYHLTGNAYSALLTGPHPSPRKWVQAAYVIPGQHTFVMYFGGVDSGGNYLDDIWIQDLSLNRMVMPDDYTITVTITNNDAVPHYYEVHSPQVRFATIAPGATVTLADIGPARRNDIIVQFIDAGTGFVETTDTVTYDHDTRTWEMHFGPEDLDVTITWTPTSIAWGTGVDPSRGDNSSPLGVTARLSRAPALVINGAVSRITTDSTSTSGAGGDACGDDPGFDIEMYPQSAAMLTDTVAVIAGRDDYEEFSTVWALIAQLVQIDGTEIVAAGALGLLDPEVSGAYTGDIIVQVIDSTHIVCCQITRNPGTTTEHTDDIHIVAAEVDPDTLTVVTVGTPVIVETGDPTILAGGATASVGWADKPIGHVHLGNGIGILQWNLRQQTAAGVYTVRSRARAYQVTGTGITLGATVDTVVDAGLTGSIDGYYWFRGIDRLTDTRGIGIFNGYEYEPHIVVYDVDPGTLTLTVTLNHPLGRLTTNGGDLVVGDNSWLAATVVALDSERALLIGPSDNPPAESAAQPDATIGCYWGVLISIAVDGTTSVLYAAPLDGETFQFDDGAIAWLQAPGVVAWTAWNHNTTNLVDVAAASFTCRPPLRNQWQSVSIDDFPAVIDSTRVLLPMSDFYVPTVLQLPSGAERLTAAPRGLDVAARPVRRR